MATWHIQPRDDDNMRACCVSPVAALEQRKNKYSISVGLWYLYVLICCYIIWERVFLHIYASRYSLCIFDLSVQQLRERWLNALLLELIALYQKILLL